MSEVSEVVVDSGCRALRQAFDRVLEGVLEDHLALRPRWLDLAAALSADVRPPGVRVALVGARCANGALAEDLVRRLRKWNQSVGIFLCVEGLLELRDVIRPFTRAGLDDAFVLEHEVNERELRHAVTARLLAPAPEEVLKRAQSLKLPDEIRSILLYLLRRGYTANSVDAVARRFGLSRDTLNRRLREAELPACGQILRLSGDLHAIVLRNQGGLSADDIARRVGHSDGHALRLMRGRLRETEGRDPRLAALRQALAG